MTRSLPILIALILLFSTVGCNLNPEADYQKGLEAYEKKDYAAALREWRPLAEQGHALAQSSVGFMYNNGEGVDQDYQTAVKWYTLAAEQGHAKAQFGLSVMYYKGQGVIQDYVYAHMWSNLSASQEDKDAAKARDLVAKEMTLSQIAEAHSLASECVEKKYKGCGRPKR